MVSKRLIQTFGLLINPVIFRYEKEYILWVKNIDKTIKEQDIFKKVSLLGDIFIYAKPLEGAAALFVLFAGPRAEYKVGILSDILKQVEQDVDSRLWNIQPFHPNAFIMLVLNEIMNVRSDLTIVIIMRVALYWFTHIASFSP